MIHMLYDSVNNVGIRTTSEETKDKLMKHNCILLGTITGYNTGFTDTPGSVKNLTGREWKKKYLKGKYYSG